MTIDDRELLAKAQGWLLTTETGRLFTASTGMTWQRGKKEGWTPPDPETNPADLLDLIEWTRKQEWFTDVFIREDSVSIYGKRSLDLKSEHLHYQIGPFNEAFPAAVVAAIKEMKKEAA